MGRRVFAVVLMASATAGAASAEECIWWSTGVQACKDGAGNWRRLGDGEVLGRYGREKRPVEPSPREITRTPSKPTVAPAPRPAVAPTPPAPAAEALPSPSNPAPPPEPTGTVEETVSVPHANELEPVPSAAEPQPEAADPASEAPKPWWRRWLDGLWESIKSYLRLFGIGK